jgi:hypothetical protein
MSTTSVLDQPNVQKFMETCQTGDILLFNSHSGGIFGVFTTLIKYFTSSQYSHIAMVLRDPTYFGQTLTGLYVWESSYEGKPDPQDGKIKVGVQLTKMETILQEYFESHGHVVWRRLEKPWYSFSPNTMMMIHKDVYCKPYDIVLKDWIQEITGNHDSDPQKDSRFWCSALVGYIYTKAGVLSPDTKWSFLSPSNFSVAEPDKLHFEPKFELLEANTLF